MAGIMASSASVQQQCIKQGSRQLISAAEQDNELIKRCQQGELRAFEQVYRQHEQILLNLGLRMLGSKEDAEDAVQMAFLRLYRSIENYRFNAKFSTYLYRIMMNVCLDQLQKRQRRKTQDLEANDVTYTPGVEIRLQLEEAISALPDRMRGCFVLFAMQGLKQEEIAGIMNLSLGAVKAHVYQAKSKLRALLSERDSE